MVDAQIHRSIKSFLESLASNRPTPGGGSVAALSGALAASLILMVCHLTRDKEKAAPHKQALNKIKEETARLQSELLAAIDKDIEAYQAVITCYRLPKESETDKKKRTEALQAAFVQAVEVPYKTASTCNRLLELCKPVAKIGNPNAISDIAVAAYLADAAVQSALYNVKINCNQIIDVDFVRCHRRTSKTLSRQAAAHKNSISKIVNAVLDK